MNTAAILEAINVLLAGIRLLNTLGINFREVIEAQAQAEAEGRELTDEERQRFIDEARAALDQL
jgi:hypothetical protein